MILFLDLVLRGMFIIIFSRTSTVHSQRLIVLLQGAGPAGRGGIRPHTGFGKDRKGHMYPVGQWSGQVVPGPRSR